MSSRIFFQTKFFGFFRQFRYSRSNNLRMHTSSNWRPTAVGSYSALSSQVLHTGRGFFPFSANSKFTCMLRRRRRNRVSNSFQAQTVDCASIVPLLKRAKFRNQIYLVVSYVHVPIASVVTYVRTYRICIQEISGVKQNGIKIFGTYARTIDGEDALYRISVQIFSLLLLSDSALYSCDIVGIISLLVLLFFFNLFHKTHFLFGHQWPVGLLDLKLVLRLDFYA